MAVTQVIGLVVFEKLILAPRYLGFSNVVHIWSVRAIPTYTVYRLYD